MVVVVVLAAAALALSIKLWPWLAGDESPSTTIRNIAVVLAGLIAIPLAFWRALVAERQANVAQRGLLRDRYQKGAEMLGSALLSVRLGGIYGLASLAREHPDPHLNHVVRLLCAFVRHPTTDENAQADATPGRRYPRLREDVQAAVTAVTARGSGGLQGKDLTGEIDLRGAFLQGADLGSANLSGADLRGADMTGAGLSGADLRHARITSACLHRASVLETDLTGACFLGTDLSHINAQRAGFSNADLGGANLSDAQLQRADLSGAHIGIANLTGASLQDADLSGAHFGKGTRVVASDPPVSETVVAQVTQAQIDEARADPDSPPKIDPAVIDAETKAPLVWRGKMLSELPGGCGPVRAELKGAESSCAGWILQKMWLACRWARQR